MSIAEVLNGRREWFIQQGDCLDVLRTMPDGCVQCVVTSPPYFALRDYGVGGQIGLEKSPEEYVDKMVEVFREVKRVLRGDGTLWLNLGDCFVGGPRRDEGFNERWHGKHFLGNKQGDMDRNRPKRDQPTSVPPKNLLGIPWRVAFALQTDGWYLRSDIVWHKPAPMPESVTDRPTRAHEYIFLMSKNARYYYDADAIREPLKEKTHTTFGTLHHAQGNDRLGIVKSDNWAKTVPVRQPKLDSDGNIAGANKRSVWMIATQPFPDAHFATFPAALVEPCIKAGCPEGGVVLDPFNGAGTTGLVATRLNRRYVGIELNPEYVAMSERRIVADAPLLNQMR